jgi:hypothetical protein
MKKLVYSLKVLAAAIVIYCRYDNVSAKGAAEQAKVLVEDVEKICRGEHAAKKNRYIKGNEL